VLIVRVAVEIGGDEQVDRVKEIFMSYNIRRMKVKEDLAGISRVIWGRKE